MPIFQATMRNIKVTVSPFSTDNMLNIGEVTLLHIKQRIQSVTDNTDSPAKPLKPNYAEQKQKGRFVALGGPVRYKGKPVRDWTLRGRVMKGLKVKYASEERVTIGPTSEETGKIVTARNRLDKMWGLSPSDTEALHAAVIDVFVRNQIVQVQQEEMAQSLVA